jgi:hypothetical protein
MPISIRGANDDMGGNRITLARFDVPVGIADPARRINVTRERCVRVRNERATAHVQLLAGAMNLMPRWYIGSMLRKVDFVASDVPGIPVPVYLGGAKVRMQYAFGPTIGASVNVTLLTYVDTCALGIDVDTGAIPVVEQFRQCLIDGFDEVLALALRVTRAGACAPLRGCRVRPGQLCAQLDNLGVGHAVVAGRRAGEHDYLTTVADAAQYRAHLDQAVGIGEAECIVDDHRNGVFLGDQGRPG